MRSAFVLELKFRHGLYLVMCTTAGAAGERFAFVLGTR
jgi:hypothetical protein